MRDSFRAVRMRLSRLNALHRREHLRHPDRAAVHPRAAELRALRRAQPGLLQRQHAVHVLLHPLLAGGESDQQPWQWRLIIWYGGGRILDHQAADARRSWWPSSATPTASSCRSATSPRSTTSCSRRWPPPSGSSRSWTSRRRSAIPSSRCALDAVRGKVEFRDVWFAYNPDDWVLRGISLHHPAGRERGLRRRDRGRQDLADQPDLALLRRAGGPGAGGRPGRARGPRRTICGAISGPCCRTHSSSPARSPRNIRLSNQAISDERSATRRAT